MDSFPIPACDNIGIFRSKIFTGEQYRGYIASENRYFYGLRLHLVSTTNQEPVEWIVTPGAQSDINAFKKLHLD